MIQASNTDFCQTCHAVCTQAAKRTIILTMLGMTVTRYRMLNQQAKHRWQSCQCSWLQWVPPVANTWEKSTDLCLTVNAQCFTPPLMSMASKEPRLQKSARWNPICRVKRLCSTAHCDSWWLEWTLLRYNEYSCIEGRHWISGMYRHPDWNFELSSTKQFSPQGHRSLLAPSITFCQVSIKTNLCKTKWIIWAAIQKVIYNLNTRATEQNHTVFIGCDLANMSLFDCSVPCEGNLPVIFPGVNKLPLHASSPSRHQTSSCVAGQHANGCSLFAALHHSVNNNGTDTDFGAHKNKNVMYAGVSATVIQTEINWPRYNLISFLLADYSCWCRSIVSPHLLYHGAVAATTLICSFCPPVTSLLSSSHLQKPL